MMHTVILLPLMHTVLPHHHIRRKRRNGPPICNVFSSVEAALSLVHSTQASEWNFTHGESLTHRHCAVCTWYS
jgi:hypothetical protein